MKHIKIIILLVFTMLLVVNVACVRDIKVIYPETMKINHKDVYFNDTIYDPYQWLESIHSDTTTAWIKEQNNLTFDYLSKISFREKIRKDLIKIRNAPMTKYSLLGNKYYISQVWFDNYFKEDSVIIYGTNNLKDKTHIVVNLKKLPDIDSTKYIIDFCISPDNRYFSYMYALPQDSGKVKIRIRDVENELSLTDTINITANNCKWLDWIDDNLYYYTRQKNKNWGIFSHKPYTAQEDDSLVLQYYCTNIRLSRDKRYLFFLSDSEKLKIKSLENSASEIVSVDSFKQQRYPGNNWQSIQNYGNDIYMFCNENPLQNKLMKVNIASDKQKWETVIPENEDILTDFYLVKDKILAHYLHNASSRLFVFDLDGKNKTPIPLPAEYEKSGNHYYKSYEELRQPRFYTLVNAKAGFNDKDMYTLITSEFKDAGISKNTQSEMNINSMKQLNTNAKYNSFLMKQETPDEKTLVDWKHYWENNRSDINNEYFWQKP